VRQPLAWKSQRCCGAGLLRASSAPISAQPAEKQSRFCGKGNQSKLNTGRFSAGKAEIS
jgi:hypothetical protein